jgi:hypothetical protein
MFVCLAEQLHSPNICPIAELRGTVTHLAGDIPGQGDRDYPRECLFMIWSAVLSRILDQSHTLHAMVPTRVIDPPPTVVQ